MAPSDIARMGEISRALARRHYDRAFVLVRELAGPSVAAAFLLESGVPVAELPRGAQRAIAESRST